jgi:hypothetical protein
VNVTLCGTYYAQELDFIGTQFAVNGKTVEQLLGSVGLNMVQFQMAQVGLRPSSVANLTVWSALYQLERSQKSLNFSCSNPKARLICAPVTTAMTDECASQTLTVQTIAGVDSDTINKGIKITQPRNLRSRMKELLEAPQILSQAFETASVTSKDIRINGLDDIFLPMFDDKDAEHDASEQKTLDKTGTSGHSTYNCGTASPLVSCLDMMLDGGSSFVVCSTPNTNIACPVADNGELIFARQIADTNTSLFSNLTSHHSMEFSISCLLRANPPTCKKTLLYTNELPILRIPDSIEFDDFLAQTRYSNEVDYCSFQCSQHPTCAAFWVTNRDSTIFKGRCALYSHYNVNSPLQNCDLRLPSCSPNVPVIESSLYGTGWFYKQDCDNNAARKVNDTTSSVWFYETFPAGAVAETTCTFFSIPANFSGSSAGSLSESRVRDIALYITAITDDLACTSPFNLVQCGLPVREEELTVLGDFGSMYKVTTDTKHYIIDHLRNYTHLGDPAEEQTCNQFKIRLTSEKQFQVCSYSFSMLVC